MSTITLKHQALVEEHPSPLTVLLNPVPLCRHFLTHWGAETWVNERSYSAYDFMGHRTVSENQGAPGVWQTVRYLGVRRRARRFSTSVGLPAVPEGGNGVFLRAGRREHVEARKKWVPQIKLPVAGTWRPLRKIREPVTTSHAPPCSHCAGKCPL